MALREQIDRITKLAEADATGDVVAHRELLEEVHKLQLSIETPFDTTARFRFQPLQNIVVLVALENGILPYVAKRNGETVTSSEIAKATSVDQLLPERLMRMNTWIGYADEVGENTYAANDTTKLVCTPGMTAGERHHTELFYPIGANITSLMRTQGFHQFAEDGLKDPFEHAFGCTLWDFFAINEEHKTGFDLYMAARRPASQKAWFEVYPAAQKLAEMPALKEGGVVLVDVGGGHGHEVAGFKKAFPDIVGKMVLQDLPATLESAKLPKGIETMVHDFFQPQPVKGARIYYLRQVMHDWMDSKCNTILQYLVAAMDKNSRLLIDDYVMPVTGAEFRPIHMDIAMMLYCRAIERTRTQWAALLESVGLEIVEVFTPENGFESVIEAKLAA
ncbi:hypothetical protein B0A55_01072 [Friedmanniomyces simplex]|uniref:O-methyltransferase C-terminal domain-containing protein n=1 Tax=Friedmanniomyces simplex TaxID=329884 RepID=A0A4U0XXX2_9PEZI|nr:hypothetical protein B0A55_01072 [Friedmanniomyces simplex]